MKRPPLLLDPIRTNAGVRAAYRRRLQVLIHAMAKSMLTHIRAAYGRADLTIGFAADDSPTETIRQALAKWGWRWRRKLDKASAEIAEMFAADTRDDVDRRLKVILREAGFTVKFKPTRKMRQAYRAVISENVNLIKSIAPQFLKDVETATWQAVMAGHDRAQLATSIREKYGIASRRAAFIARDQSNKARAIMEEQRRSDLGITHAVWKHSHAGKHPRPTHVEMDGERYEIKRGMWDSAVEQWVWPGTLPNCRCTSAAIIE